MTAVVQALDQLARLIVGEPHTALARLLTLTCELTAMDLAFVSVLDGAGHRTVRLSVFADGTPGPSALTEPLEDTWCGRVIADDGLIIDDVQKDATLLGLPLTSAYGIVSYAGVPLRDKEGRVMGTVCALGRAPHPSLGSREREVLVSLARVIAPLVKQLDWPDESRSTASGLEGIAVAVDGADDVERLTRPLLEALADLTGMASTYLTVVHQVDGVQEIRYAHNSRADLGVSEGLLVPWDDALCKRSLDEGRAYTADVPAIWGDNPTGRALGVHSYLSVPVQLPDGTLWGTLCAADSVSAEGAEKHVPTMRLFARIIATEVEREDAARREQLASDTDPLTGCASRRVVQPWLFNQMVDLSSEEVVVAAFVHVGSVKSMNETFGRAAGDAVLAEVGHRLRSALRSGDLVARYGGDEFLVAVRVPRTAALQLARRVRAALEFSVHWQDTTVEVQTSLGVALSDGHDGPSLVAAADEAMHGIRRRH